MPRPNPILLAIACALVAAGCSPALDWREFIPEGSAVQVAFPCRPDRQARDLDLVGARVRMEMLACAAEGMTFALAYADVAEPAGVGPALAALRATAAANIQAPAPEAVPLSVPGMTPNPQAARLALQGRLPDGAVVREHAAFFSHGLRVYQASVIGAAPTPAAIDAFVASLRFPS